jgi:plastocyanin
MAVRIFAVAGATLVLAFAVACGGTTPGTTPAPGATAAASPAAGCPATLGKAVDIVDFGYNPQSITVAVGEAVTWVNTGAAPHTVTFDAGPDCGRMNPGQSVSHAFDTAGSFTYHCTIHASMRGTVVVQ